MQLINNALVVHSVLISQHMIIIANGAVRTIKKRKMTSYATNQFNLSLNTQLKACMLNRSYKTLFSVLSARQLKSFLPLQRN